MSSRYVIQKSLSTSFMATSSIPTLPGLANPNNKGIYRNVPKELINAQVQFSLCYKLREHLKTKTLYHHADCVGFPVCLWGGSCPWLSAYSALLGLWPTSFVCPSSSLVLMVKPRDSLKVLSLLDPTTHPSESVDSLSDLGSTVSLWIYRGFPGQ